MKPETKLLKAIQHLNYTKNMCFELNLLEYKKLLKIRTSLIKKLEKL